MWNQLNKKDFFSVKVNKDKKEEILGQNMDLLLASSDLFLGCHALTLTQVRSVSGSRHTLLPISCKSVQPVPARVEEPASPVRQSSSGGATNNPPFPKMHCLTGLTGSSTQVVVLVC